MSYHVSKVTNNSIYHRTQSPWRIVDCRQEVQCGKCPHKSVERFLRHGSRLKGPETGPQRLLALVTVCGIARDFAENPEYSDRVCKWHPSIRPEDVPPHQKRV